jgi:hypothetical protein
MLIFSGYRGQNRLLIAKSVLGTAIRTLPGNAVAGHAPLIFIHACLTNGKPAPAGPAERGGTAAAVTNPVDGPSAAAVFRITGRVCF